MKYVSRVTINAIQFTGDNLNEVKAFLEKYKTDYRYNNKDNNITLTKSNQTLKKGMYVCKHRSFSLVRFCCKTEFERRFKKATGGKE